MNTWNQDTSTAADLEALERDLDGLEAMTDLIRLSSHATAGALAAARQGQMAAELARVLRRKGAGDPEVQRRRANLDRASRRFALLAEEGARARLQRPDPTTTATTLWGRVTRAGAATEGLQVSVEAEGERIACNCSDAAGGFSLTVPAQRELQLSVYAKDGTACYRDSRAFSLSEGQHLYREIDLTRSGTPPCPAPDQPDGPASDSVPMVRLIGKSESEGIALIQKLGLRLGTVSTQSSNNQVGLIVAQEPAVGAPIRRDAMVSIVLGILPQITVPQLVGLQPKPAEQRLTEAGLRVLSVIHVPSEREQNGLIVAQSPEAGTTVEPESSITLSLGVWQEIKDDLVTVPKLLDQPLETAERLLKELDLISVIGNDVPVPPSQAGRVVHQHPGAGERVAKRSVVTLAIGRSGQQEPAEVSVPDLRGEPLENVQTILKKALLKLGDVKLQSVEPPQVGQVLDQDPAPGTFVTANTPISLVVGQAQEAANDVRDLLALVEASVGTPLKLMERFSAAGITTLEGIDDVLAMDRNEARTLFGVRTLKQTDAILLALKLARQQQGR